MTRSFPPFVLGSWGLALILSVLLLPSCGDSTGPDGPPLSGITRTLPDGRLVEDDTLDWQPRIAVSSGVGIPEPQSESLTLGPAYPNPTSSSVSLQFALAAPSMVRIWAVDKEGDVVQVLTDNTVGIQNSRFKIQKEGLF